MKVLLPESAIHFRHACTLVLVLLLLAGTSAAFADVFGRLQFSVKNADDETPLAGAKITLHDTAGVHADMSLLTDKDGAALSPPLEIRLWNVSVTAELFEIDVRQVQVSADISTPVEVLLEPLKETVVKITGTKDLVSPSQTSDSHQRDHIFIMKFPYNVANPQNLANLETTNPGTVQDSNNQVHARGEHASTMIYVGGVPIPGANQGRIGQVLTPSTVQSADVLTGAYAPEYGEETAAILNLDLRSGSMKPSEDFTFGGGLFPALLSGGATALTHNGATGNVDANFSGQLGAFINPSGSSDADSDSANAARRLGYFLDFSGRATDVATQAPQPDQQNAHNAGTDENMFGNFNYTLGSSDKLSLTLNDDPAYSQIANRTGLPSEYATVGQGYGYAGHLSAAQAAAEGIGTQQQDGQDINQRDLNQFAILNWQHTINATTTSNFSMGYIRSELDLTNNNPAVNLNNLPADNSIEFNPESRAIPAMHRCKAASPAPLAPTPTRWAPSTTTNRAPNPINSPRPVN